MRIEIRSIDHRLNAVAVGQVQRRLRFALGRFEGVVDCVNVRLRDVHQVHRHEWDQSCRVEVALAFGETVDCEATGSDLLDTVDAVSDRIARLVTNHLKRHQKARMARVVV
jgi:hypothetical protein